jgi:hypothetical protein
MNVRSHADHRWPVDKDPAYAWCAAPTLLDQFYPLDDVVAVIDARPAAERAAQALKDAGVPESDVDLVDGAWFARAAHSVIQNRGVVRRLAHVLPTDESLLARRYVEEAEQEHVIVVVHAPTQADVDRARTILVAHGAREIHHYEPRMIRDL